MLELILLQLEGLEILLQPVFDTQWFGCPDDCIVQGSQRHEMINFLFSPALFFIVGVGITVGIIFKIRKLVKERKKSKQKDIEKIISFHVPKEEESKERKGTWHFEKSKAEKKKFLQENVPVDPQQAYDNWVKALDDSHPQTEYIKTVHTETKEADLITPEQKILEERNKALQLEHAEKQVEELMKKEHITEEEAVEKVIEKDLKDLKIDEPKEKDEFIVDVDDVDEDIFSQDKPRRKPLPVPLTKLLKKLRMTRFTKQNEEKTIQVLTELGTKRRDQYAEIINAQLLSWVFPLQRYKRSGLDSKGKATTIIVTEINDDEIRLQIKKLALFCSMGEFMFDRKRKKKRYWRTVPLGK